MNRNFMTLIFPQKPVAPRYLHFVHWNGRPLIPIAPVLEDQQVLRTWNPSIAFDYFWSRISEGEFPTQSQLLASLTRFSEYDQLEGLPRLNMSLDPARFCPCSEDCPEHIYTVEPKLYSTLEMIGYHERQVAQNSLYPPKVHEDWHQGIFPNDIPVLTGYDAKRILVRYTLPGGDERLALQHWFYPVIYRPEHVEVFYDILSWKSFHPTSSYPFFGEMATLDNPPVVPVLHHPELRPVQPSSFQLSEFDSRMCESLCADSVYWPSFGQWKETRSAYVDWSDPQKVVDLFDPIRFPCLYRDGRLAFEGDSVFKVLQHRVPSF